MLNKFYFYATTLLTYSAGCIPLVGFNIGAGRKDSAAEIFKLLLIFEAILGVVALIIVECFPGVLIKIFGAANESSVYTVFAKQASRTYLCMIILATVNKGNSFIFRHLEKHLLQL